jgi:16S rRNA processing protein RimM
MYLRLGVLTRTHALDGALRLALDAPAIPSITLPQEVIVGYSESFARPQTLLSFDARSGDPICRFEGVTTHESARELVDQALFLPEEAIRYENPFSDPGLIGYAVCDESGRDLGEIIGLISTPAHYVWSIDAEDREWMLPAVEPFVVEIQHDRQMVVVRPIPGMYEEEPDDDQQQD